MKDHETEIKERLNCERENRRIVDQYQAWYDGVHKKDAANRYDGFIRECFK